MFRRVCQEAGALLLQLWGFIDAFHVLKVQGCLLHLRVLGLSCGLLGAAGDGSRLLWSSQGFREEFWGCLCVFC